MKEQENINKEEIKNLRVKNHTILNRLTILKMVQEENNKVILEKLNGFEKLFEEKFKQNETSHQIILEMQKTKANKWTEYAIGFLMTGVFGWVITEILNLIPKVQAIL